MTLKTFNYNLHFLILTVLFNFSAQSKTLYSAADSIEYSVFTAKQNCINTTDGVMKYRDEGKGEVIVLVHDVPTSSWMYRKIIPALVAQGYRVIAPDMLGFGASDSPEGTTIYQPQQHCKRLVELMNALAITRFSVVAHGSGCLWVADLLKNQPERVQKYIFINALLNAEGLSADHELSMGISSFFGFGLFNCDWAKTNFINKFLKQSNVFSNLSNQGVEGYQKPMMEGKTAAINAHTTYLSSSFFRSEFKFPFTEQPILFLQGSAQNTAIWDAQFSALNWPPSMSKAAVESIDGNYLLSEENPTEVVSRILDFLNPR